MSKAGKVALWSVLSSLGAVGVFVLALGQGVWSAGKSAGGYVQRTEVKAVVKERLTPISAAQEQLRVRLRALEIRDGQKMVELKSITRKLERFDRKLEGLEDGVKKLLSHFQLRQMKYGNESRWRRPRRKKKR